MKRHRQRSHHVMSFALMLTVKYDVFLMKCVGKDDLKWQLWTHFHWERILGLSETAAAFRKPLSNHPFPSTQLASALLVLMHVAP